MRWRDAERCFLARGWVMGLAKYWRAMDGWMDECWSLRNSVEFVGGLTDCVVQRGT